MIIANVPHHGESLPVEIVDVFTSSRGKVAQVRALAGEPFTRWTHGGWIQSDYATIPAGLVKDVAIETGIQFPVEILQEA